MRCFDSLNKGRESAYYTKPRRSAWAWFKSAGFSTKGLGSRNKKNNGYFCVATMETIHTFWDSAFWINIDKVKVMTEGGEDNGYSYNIYRDDKLIAEAVESTSFTDKEVSVATHKYGVQVNYGIQVSTMVETTIDVLTSKASVEGEKPYTLTVQHSTIEASCAGEIHLFDLQGRLLSQGRDKLCYQTPSGLYLLRFSVNGRTYTEKVLIP